MGRRRFTWRHLAAGGVALLAIWLVVRGCRGRRPDGECFEEQYPLPSESEKGDVLVTGYCNCGVCCGWRNSWLGIGPPVYNYGPMKGRRKEVGVTARGTVARHGTVAADPKIYPFGTRLSIPGYGTGVVEDVGGAITGRHIDVWFPSHGLARRWGCRNLNVTVIAH